MSITTKPLISYRGMEKSIKLLYDFCFFYLPASGFQPKVFFELFPVLTFMEAMVYQADEEVENQASEIPYTKNKQIMIELLQEKGWYDDFIKEALDEGDEYFALEQKINNAEKFTLEELKKVCELRTFDMRLLHKLVLKILNKPYDENVFKLIFPIEVLGEIDDDLFQYQDDVKNKSFNTYRMFIKLYGKDAPKRLEEECQKYFNDFEECMATLPGETQEEYMKLFEKYREDYPKPEIPEPIFE